MLCQVHLTICGIFELTTLVVISTDFIGSCKPNYNTMTPTMASCWLDNNLSESIKSPEKKPINIHKLIKCVIVRYVM